MSFKKIRISFIFYMVCLLLTAPLSLEAATTTRIYSVPGHPLALTIQSDRGVIKEAWLRSPAGLHPLNVLQGKKITGSAWRQPLADSDLCPDLIWRLSFVDSNTSKVYFLWITSLTETPRAWLAITPAGGSCWDSLPLQLSMPDDVFLYVSPTLPSYSELEKIERESSSLLTFVYTVGLTRDGPNFVLVPEVYKQLLPITELVRQAETDPVIKNAYNNLYDDFEKMGKGQTPSREAIINFSWKKILSLNWQN